MGASGRARACLLLAAAASLGVPSAAAETAGDLAAALDRFMREQTRRANVPGAAVAVVDAAGRVHAAGYGVTGEGSVVTADTPFYLGSVTKALTALAVARLRDEGRLGFDDQVRRHLPGFALADADAAAAITLRHLLTHTSGLSTWSGHDRLAQEHGRFAHVRPRRRPGETFEYSSLNFIVLGQVVEAASGMPYARYMERAIFTPLGMRGSRAVRPPDPVPLPRGHRYLFGLTVPGSEALPPRALVPAGFLVSTATDLARLIEMVLGGGVYRGRTVVSRGSLDEMFTPWAGAETGPGLGWGVGRTLISHAGNTPTFSARIGIGRDRRWGVAVLANVNSGPFFAGTADLLDGAARLARGEARATYRPDELFVKAAMAAALAWSLVQLLRAVRSWRREARPLALPRRPASLRPLLIEAAVAVVVLWGVPRWIGVPLRVLVEYFPDLALAMVLSVSAGLLRAALRAARTEALPARAGGAAA